MAEQMSIFDMLRQPFKTEKTVRLISLFSGYDSQAMALKRLGVQMEHVGSASSLIACRNTNHKYVGFEIDEEYYKLAKKRLEQETSQMNIFDYM